jgi:hypothetical protein
MSMSAIINVLEYLGWKFQLRKPGCYVASFAREKTVICGPECGTFEKAITTAAALVVEADRDAALAIALTALGEPQLVGVFMRNHAGGEE